MASRPASTAPWGHTAGDSRGRGVSRWGSGLRNLVPTTRGLSEGGVPHVSLSQQFRFKASVHRSRCVPCTQTSSTMPVPEVLVSNRENPDPLRVPQGHVHTWGLAQGPRWHLEGGSARQQVLGTGPHLTEETGVPGGSPNLPRGTQLQAARPRLKCSVCTQGQATPQPLAPRMCWAAPASSS